MGFWGHSIGRRGRASARGAAHQAHGRRIGHRREIGAGYSHASATTSSHIGILTRTAALMAGALLLSACASDRYMGISLVPGAASPQMQALAQRAQAGDKQAQLDLGIAYEEGKGVPVNIDRAIRLYRMAATTSGSPMGIYMPSPGGGAPARVMPVDRPVRYGLAEAQQRLMRVMQ